MFDIFGWIGSIFGWVLWGAFSLVHDYGLAIIIFTVVLKLILFPVSIKQQKSMAANARLSGKQQELQKKYGNDKAKLNEEMSKLYEREGVSPMAAALPPCSLCFCSWAFIMPLLTRLPIRCIWRLIR